MKLSEGAQHRVRREVWIPSKEGGGIELTLYTARDWGERSDRASRSGSWFPAFHVLRPFSSATQPCGVMAALSSSRTMRSNLTTHRLSSLSLASCPCLQSLHGTSKAQFSTSQPLRKRDNNKNRGTSAVRSTGIRPRQTLSIKQKDFENQRLPKPVEVKHEYKGTPDHGLWDFFKDQELLQTPVVEQRHGIEHLRTSEIVTG